jgi:hypothetical protein
MADEPRPLAALSDEEFLCWCYRTVLFRDPDPEGKAFYLQKLGQGADRWEILWAFLASEEFTRAHLTGELAPGGRDHPFLGAKDLAAPIPSLGPWASVSSQELCLWEGLSPSLQKLSKLFPIALPSGDPPWQRLFPSRLDSLILVALADRWAPKRIVEIGGQWLVRVWGEPKRQTGQRFASSPWSFPPTLWRLSEEAFASRACLELASLLEAWDFLLIRSGPRMVRRGDLLLSLFFELFPRLAPGVVIVFYPVFYPFEYPWFWLWARRLPWSDLYLLRAYFTGNPEGKILLFSHRLASLLADLFVPFSSEEPPLTLWLQKAGSLASPPTEGFL